MSEPSLHVGAFNAYAFFSSLLLLKFLAMSLLTVFQRIRKKVFASPEDVEFQSGEVNKTDPDVERVRMAHMNDIENIIPFLIIALLYCYTDPGTTVASILFLIFTLARYAYTVVYAIYVVRQPARAICFFIGYTINIYMILRIIIAFAQVVSFG